MKKVFHHVNRTLLRCLEAAGILALLLVLGWVGLLWRLSQGPLDVSPWLTQKMESAFDRDISGFHFKLGGMQLIWGGRFEPFEFEMRDVHISRDDKTPVLDVKKLHVQLSKRNLVFGRIVPRVVRVYGPALRVIRQQDGRFSLNVGDEAPPELIGPPAPADLQAEQSRQELVRGVLKLLQERQGLGLLDGLREVTISDAALLYVDNVLDVRWLSRNADVDISRGDNGIRASSLVTVMMDQKNKATVRAEVNYDWNTQRTEASVAFTGFVPARVAQSSEELKQLSDIDMPFSGNVSFSLDPDFKPSTGRFAVGADEGTFNAMGLYKEPIHIESLYASGDLDVSRNSAEVSVFKADLGGPEAQGKLKIEKQDGIYVATVNGVLVNMPMNSVKTYWPDSLTPDPRFWVTNHLMDGMATRATIDMALAYDPAAEKKISLRELGGKIEFNGIKVDYLPPLPPVLNVAGSATYDRSSFHLDLHDGKIEDMKAPKGHVDIVDLDKIGQGGESKIDIAVSVSGSLKTALHILDSKPLEYPEMLGLKTTDVGGHADVDLGIKFPIHKSMTLKDIHIEAKAKLKEVMLKDVVAGMELRGGPMDLEVDNTHLNVKGKGVLGDMPVEFDWLKNFPKDQSFASTLTATLPLDTPALAKFGMPGGFDTGGTLPATVDYKLKQDKSAVLILKGDIKPFAFSVPMIDFKKSVGVDGKVTMMLDLQDNKLQRITGLDLTGGGISVKGDIDFNRDGMGALGVKKAHIREFLMGSTDIAVDAETTGKDGYSLKVTGRQIDASPLFKDNVKPNSDEEAAKQQPPLRINMSVGHILTGPDRSIDHVKAYVVRNAWKRIEQLEVDAQAGGKPLTLRYLPSGKGHSLKFDAQDAGAALIAFGVAKSVRGGTLTVNGRPMASGGPRDMVGTASLNNFKIANAPVIAKLLNALSLVGILQMMGDNGLAFKKAGVEFTWIDKGQPAQKENVRFLKLKDGKTYGSSLGLAFEGNIDNWKNTYDLNGTIVPVSDLSKLISIIPIIGTVLTAGGEGIFAATYTIKGTKEEPVVAVNPLSIIAPGILRKMFFR